MQPATVDVPLVDGPGAGQIVHTLVGPDGRPPLTHSFLHEGLADAVLYELEWTGGDPPWSYVFRGVATTERPAPGKRTGA